MTNNDGTPTMRGNFVLLKAGHLQLLLPQDDVGAAEFLDGTVQPSLERCFFEVTTGGAAQERLLVALSERMTLLEEPPRERFLLTAFPARPGILMCWDEVQVLLDKEIAPCALPPAVMAPGAPVSEYVEFGDDIAFLCDADRLLAHVFSVQG